MARFGISWPVDVEAIAREVGIGVVRSDELGRNSGMITRDASAECPGGYRIAVNGRQAVTRQRFTIAHELAHVELHAELIGDGVLVSALYRSPEFSAPQEIEANARAAEIIMPRALIMKALELETDTRKLASMFAVSPIAMETRLRELEVGQDFAVARSRRATSRAA